MNRALPRRMSALVSNLNSKISRLVNLLHINSRIHIHEIWKIAKQVKVELLLHLISKSNQQQLYVCTSSMLGMHMFFLFHLTKNIKVTLETPSLSYIFVYT